VVVNDVGGARDELPDGRFAYDMKRALPDGRRRLVMTGVELLEKLAALIPASSSARRSSFKGRACAS
jgi:hypothetical protein